MAHIEKRGRRWRARFRAPDGRERSRTWDRKIDAENWLIDQQAARQQGTWVDPALGRISFAKWVDKWKPTIVDLRPTTKVLYLGVVNNYLLPRFGPAPLAAIRSVDVKEMLAAELNDGKLSASSVRRHVLVLSVIMQSAVADGRISRNPCAGVKLPAETTRKMRFLEPHEVIALANAIVPHYRPLVLTAAYVGLRWGELAGLALDRVDLLRRTIRVEEQLVEANG
jgi:integrase